MITVVLNAFKRQEYLYQQIEAVLNQSVPVTKILVWNNGQSLDVDMYGDKIEIANNSANLGVWSRFSYALNAETEFVCVLDDDTIPGRRFFENCLNCMQSQPALLGARGLRFLSSSKYEPYESFGWGFPNSESQYVDIVGHAWFFKREWLGLFWRDLPELGSSRLVGEDMHFSHMLQKYSSIPTMVPPHPSDQLDLWGSLPESGALLGTSKAAISQASGAMNKFDVALRSCVKRGFKLIKDSDPNHRKVIVLGPGLTRYKWLKRLVTFFPLLDRGLRFIQKKLISLGIYL